MLDKAYAAIMAGGKGERFWPLSTSEHPKQVLSLVGEKPMLQTAIDRLEGIIPPERVLVITSADLVDVTRKTAPQLPPKNIIGEPFGRDTAAVCALASAIANARTPGAACCILTADHVIGDSHVFRAVLEESFELALSRDVLITIGIKPTYPSTGFGYIEHKTTPLQRRGTVTFVSALGFREKPDLETAKKCLDAGNFCWNSGMFIWSAESFRRALEKHAPPLLDMARAMGSVDRTPEFHRALGAEYSKLKKISVDYAIMEKADNIVMAIGTFSWSDVGSWNAMEEHFGKTPEGNVVLGNAESMDSEGNIVVSEERLTALIGVKDMIVVQAEGATLICPKERAQDVKRMVQQMRDKGGYE